MRKENQIQRNWNILLLLLGTSFGLYIIVAYDYIMKYEIFFGFPLLLTLLGSIGLFFVSITFSIKHKQLPSLTTIIIFTILTTSYILAYGDRNGLFWGKKIIEAAFIDDRSRVDLSLYKNGKFTIFSNWFFGEQRFEGTYKMNGDTIIFNKCQVVDNGLVSKEIIIDKQKNRIYFNKDKEGKYDTRFYYFQIDF